MAHWKEMPFEDIHRCFLPLIYSYLRKLSIPPRFHDDFIQVGTIGLWEAYKQYDPEKGAFPALAHLYVKGQMIRLLEKEDRYRLHHQTVEDNHTHAASYHVERDVCSDLFVKELMEHLSRRERLWVHETLIEGKKVSEIAQEHDVSVNTVKTWRKNALRKLRVILEKHGD